MHRICDLHRLEECSACRRSKSRFGFGSTVDEPTELAKSKAERAKDIPGPLNGNGRLPTTVSYDAWKP